MGAEAALGSAPEVVRESDGRDRGDGRPVDQSDLPADQRQTQTSEAEAKGSAGVEHVAELPGAVDEAAEVAPGRAVAQRQLELTHPQTGPRRVDRHSHLASEPWGGRETRLPCGRREQTLAGERLARFEPGQKGDQAPRDPLRDAEASADSLGKYGDAQVRAVLDEWREVAGQIRVAEQKEAGRCCPLRRGQRLPLPATPKAQHDPAGLFRT